MRHRDALRRIKLCVGYSLGAEGDPIRFIFAIEAAYRASTLPVVFRLYITLALATLAGAGFKKA